MASQAFSVAMSLWRSFTRIIFRRPSLRDYQVKRAQVSGGSKRQKRKAPVAYLIQRYFVVVGEREAFPAVGSLSVTRAARGRDQHANNKSPDMYRRSKSKPRDQRRWFTIW